MNIKMSIVIIILVLIHLEPVYASASNPKDHLSVLKKKWERLDQKINANLTDPNNMKAFKILERFYQKHTEERMNNKGRCKVIDASTILRSSPDDKQIMNFRLFSYYLKINAHKLQMLKQITTRLYGIHLNLNLMTYIKQNKPLQPSKKKSIDALHHHTNNKHIF